VTFVLMVLVRCEDMGFLSIESISSHMGL